MEDKNKKEQEPEDKDLSAEITSDEELKKVSGGGGLYGAVTTNTHNMPDGMTK